MGRGLPSEKLSTSPPPIYQTTPTRAQEAALTHAVGYRVKGAAGNKALVVRVQGLERQAHEIVRIQRRRQGFHDGHKAVARHA
jgi:hypothetical protein